MLSRRRAAVAGIDASWPRRHAVSGVGSVHESPKSLPSDMLRMLGLLHSLGLVVIPLARQSERTPVPLRGAIDRELRPASFCSRACCRSRAIPHAPAPRGSDTGPRCDLPLSACAGRLPEWSDPRPRQPPEDWTPARRLLILPLIASSGSAETSSRPGLHNVTAVARSRRQDRPPSGRRRLGLDGGEHDGILRHVGIVAG